jgi:predicted TIM-barrel fold metal-dependent hydrolase
MTTTKETAPSREAELGYRLFDADNHYYETEDAFLRHLDPRLVHKAPRWVQMTESGAKRLVFGDRMNRFLGADNTFSAVGRAGSLSQGEAGVVKQQRANLEPIHADYRERDARLAVMDRQGLESSLLFPTLAVSVEPLLADDVEATYCNLHAFNQWLDDDWGFNYEGRIYGVPLISLLDPFLSVEELEFVVGRGARAVHLRTGPVAGRSPADRLFDRFWAAVAAADVAVVFHACDDSYRHELGKIWGWGNVNIPARNIPPLQRVIAGNDRPIHDTIASLIYCKLFERFPTLRLGTVELGCGWVPHLIHNLDQAGQGDLAEHPIDTFRKHIWVAPFEDEDLTGLAEAIGTDRIMFGSDYPHTDGLAEPATYAKALKGFDDAGVRKIMRDNASHLLGTHAAH